MRCAHSVGSLGAAAGRHQSMSSLAHFAAQGASITTPASTEQPRIQPTQLPQPAGPGSREPHTDWCGHAMLGCMILVQHSNSVCGGQAGVPQHKAASLLQSSASTHQTLAVGRRHCASQQPGEHALRRCCQTRLQHDSTTQVTCVAHATPVSDKQPNREYNVALRWWAKSTHCNS